MISNHYFAMYSNPYHDACAAGMIVIGFVVVRILYWKSTKVQGF